MHSPIGTARRWVAGRAVGDAPAAVAILAAVLAHDLVDPPGGVGTPSSSDGRGLSGMRERAASFEGVVEASPRARGGWRVASRLRLDEARDVA